MIIAVTRRTSLTPAGAWTGASFNHSETDAMWTEDVRRNFSGEIMVGRDLMTI